MRRTVSVDMKKCVGCNRCIRACPVEEANIAYMEGATTKVRVDATKCIACGGCMLACVQGSRSYEDDTERFFADLGKGVPISVFCAPAGRANLEQWDKVLALLRQMGARKIYDVSLGADICTWGYIRHIQKNHPPAIISQPCPAIVDYILMHRNELLPYLSPVQSPMMCTAIYMKRYQGINDKIAAISPCIAKSNEFEETGGVVSYNITFARLEDYIQRNKLRLPAQGEGYDHIDSSLGSIYSTPGGLKENVEFMIGKVLRIDQCEGQSVVYKALDEFAAADKADLPAVFDVLNCPEGCNLGTGCRHQKTRLQVNAAMDKARRNAVKDRDREYFEKLYQEYDKTLRLDDFIRRYRPLPAHTINIKDSDIEAAFLSLNKRDPVSREFDCSACGSETCPDMARKIAKKINVPRNCIQYAHQTLEGEQARVIDWQKHNVDAINAVAAKIAVIKEQADKIVGSVASINKVLSLYDDMAKEIDRIASNVHMISLNASIEAARAGEHGRSFAVVADAIRGLAGESQAATAEVSKATVEAKRTLGGISGILTTIGGDIAQAHTDVDAIAADTNSILSKVQH